MPGPTPDRDLADDRTEAVMEAYEAALEGREPADNLDAEASRELASLLSLHRRLGPDLGRASVAPRVRAAVLSAAVEETTRRAQEAPWWRRVASWLLRPAPAVAGLTLAALAVAVAVRLDRQETAAPARATAEATGPVALLESPPAPAAQPSPLASPAGAAPEAPPVAAADRVPLIPRPRPGEAIAASPASLEPPEPIERKKAEVNAPRFAQAPPARKQAPAAERERQVQAAADDEPPAPAGAAGLPWPGEKDGESVQAVRGLEAEAQAAAQEQAAPARDQAQGAQSPPGWAPAQATARSEPPQTRDARSTAELEKLKRRLAQARTLTERRQVLQEIFAIARKSGDARTRDWAQTQLSDLEEPQAHSASTKAAARPAAKAPAKAKAVPAD